MELRDDYTSIVVSYSTGIDSTGALVKALALASKIDHPRLFLLYCDTGMEYEINEALFYQTARMFDMIPILLKNDRDFYDLLMARQMWPDMKNRWCTSYLKTGVTNKWIRANRAILGERCLFVTGERRDESPRRAKYEALTWHDTTLKTERVGKFICHWWRPVLDYEKKDMFNAGKGLGLEPHPCYEYVGRCSCMFCIFMPDRHTVENLRHNPKQAKKWLQAELDIGHKWKSKISLNELWDGICEEVEPEVIV